MRRHKREQREELLLHETHDREAIDLRHLQVEQCEIGLRTLDQHDRLRTAGRLANELHVAALREQPREKGARGALIVRDDDT